VNNHAILFSFVSVVTW